VQLDPDLCYRALQTRDARFDGRFFTAVRSTGVYCRPICPARTPKRENCLFLPCAAAAQEAGFRPCLRCRPEASPGTPAWLGTSATVSRALRLIGQGELDGGSVESLAGRLGIGERHLRRLFLAHLGATPVAVAQNRRMLFAKKLIDETALPMVEVALAAGFSSVRRFNDAIARSYGRSPTRLRRARRRPADAPGSEIALQLPFRPPYPWQALLAFLAARATPGVESVSGGVYRRSVRIGDATGVVSVEAVRGAHHLLARIRLDSSAVLIDVAERLRRLVDLGADPAAIDAHLRRDPRLRAGLASLPGMRVPGAWDGFELAVRAVLGQQVSVRGATTLASRLVERFGEALPAPAEPGLTHLFPEPAALAEADVAGIGLPAARAAAIRALARAVAEGRLALDGGLELDALIARLCEIPGIGAWTAHYVAMRACGETDAFPAGDLGLRRAFGNGRGPASERALLVASEAWRPFRAYAALHLWTAPKPVASPRARARRTA
jgi:AraC family transcriptional regulator, regulatory protein of adaptative response / DNA-3-methyladenine glycosylase II